MDSISKRALSEASTEIVEELGGFESKLQSIVSKLDIEVKLENKVNALEGHLKEFENTCLAQEVQIADLQGILGESNKSIKDLENRINRIKVALVVLSILFTSSLLLVGYTQQSYDLFAPYYAASKTNLNALLTNPLIDNLWAQFGQLSRLS